MMDEYVHGHALMLSSRTHTHTPGGGIHEGQAVQAASRHGRNGQGAWATQERNHRVLGDTGVCVCAC